MHDHGDYYHGPSFQFHPGDFLRDVAHLDATEIGAYWLLIMYAWDNYGIPNDPRRIANIAKLAPRQAATVWPALESFWKPHPQGCGCLINPGLEKRRSYASTKADNGKKGGRPVSEPRATHNLTETESKPNPKANEKPSTPPSSSIVEAPKSPLPVSEPPQAERVREKPQPTLALNRDVLDRASELKGLHWRLVEAAGLKLSVGKTLWGKRNNAVARALAENGITVAQYEIAWKSLHTEMGEPPREMAPVAKHLDRLGTPKGRRANEVRAPYHQPYTPEAEPELTDAQREANRKRLRELTGRGREVAS